MPIITFASPFSLSPASRQAFTDGGQLCLQNLLVFETAGGVAEFVSAFDADLRKSEASYVIVLMDNTQKSTREATADMIFRQTFFKSILYLSLLLPGYTEEGEGSLFFTSFQKTPCDGAASKLMGYWFPDRGFTYSGSLFDKTILDDLSCKHFKVISIRHRNRVHRYM